MRPTEGESREDPIAFVAHHLRQRWPELTDEDSTIAFADVPPVRWAPLESIWVVSTYLRLRNQGLPVVIRDRVDPTLINVCCDEAVLHHPGSDRSFLVVTRGDRSALSWADFELIQSPAQKLTGPGALMKHWPQPGLLPRDPERGDVVKTLGYVGPLENLAERYRSAEFKSALEDLGVELVIKTEPEDWHDFRDLDLYLAVRDWPRALIRTKPATKLAHSWITGVPALLGEEPAFRHWGSPGEDYLEVSSPAQALDGIRQLREDPARYRELRLRGALKAEEHDEATVLALWRETLWGPVQAEFHKWSRASGVRRRLRALRRKASRVLGPMRRVGSQLRMRGWRGLKKGVARRLFRSASR